MGASLYQVVHSSPEIKTVREYCKRTDSPAFKYIGREKEFLNIVGDDGLKNIDRILLSYVGVREKADNPITKQADLYLKVGTILYIPQNEIERIGLLTEGIQVVSNNTVAFKAEKLTILESDTGYVKKYKTVDPDSKQGSFKDQYPDATIWLWCRALSDTYSTAGVSSVPGEMLGEIFDITPFVETVEISTTKNGGNFKISLPPLVCELKTETDPLGRVTSRYVIKKNSLKTYKNNDTSEYVSEGSLYSEDRGDKINSFLFHTIINENDVVFIRLETLELEYEQRLKDKEKFYINKKDLVGRTYDMIGLVDLNTESIKYDQINVQTTINGRDLIKLFIDDGTYFYALENSQGQLKLSGGSVSDNELLRRVYSDNSLYYLSLYFNTSIEHILSFIIQQLSNIRVVPSDLFSSYGERLNTTFEMVNGQFTSKKVPAKGIWQIIKLVIDESVSQRRLIDSSMSSANGSLLNFIRKACQEPFVEFYTDTYGDEFFLIVRKPPYDQKSVISLLTGNVKTENNLTALRPIVIDIEAVDMVSQDLDYDRDNTYSWYHLTPQNMFIGDSSTYSLTLTPAIYFKEYAEIWGSKPLDIVHNYSAYYPDAQKECKDGDLSHYQEQTVLDLKYLIDSHAYLPFTRKGTLVVNMDRRLKRGNIIRCKATGEVFFIDSVTHKTSISDNSVDAITTLEVSRGMIEDFIYGVDINGLKNVSYFNIINTELPANYGNTDIDNSLVFSKFQVNIDIFNFFLKRLQVLSKNYTKTSR